MIEVKEKANIFEAVTALMGQEIEMANKYQVLSQEGRDLFYATEQTDCITRQMKQCCPDCAKWSVDIAYTEGGSAEKAFELRRPTTCSFLCFNRPVVEVFDVHSEPGNSKKIGSIKDPCHCCNDDFSVRDEKDDAIYEVSSGCCQIGKFCPMPCGPCAIMNFKVLKDGEQVGNVQKKIPGCCKFFFASDVDNYKIDFTSIESTNHKALLMALAIFIDFRLFSDNSADDKKPDAQE